MFLLIQHHAITLAICALLGLLTAFWMFRGGRRPKGPDQ